MAKQIKSEGLLSEIALPFSSEEFRTAWMDWIEHRNFKKQPLSPPAIRRQLRFLSTLGEQAAIKSIDNSITHNWQGLFEPKDEKPTGFDPYGHLPTFKAK